MSYNSSVRKMRPLMVLLLLQHACGWPFLGGQFNNCPNIDVDDGPEIEKMLGSWRLAYLYLDTAQEMEEDSTCAIVDFSKTNKSAVQLSFYLDTIKTDYIDRSQGAVPLTVLSPGRWALHTPLAYKGYITSRVVSLTDTYMILVFCGEVAESEDEDMGGTGKLHYKQLRDKRSAYEVLVGDKADSQPAEDMSRRLQEYMDRLQGPEMVQEKHLWTAILVKDNNVSALHFVQFASVLLKLGFQMTHGQLVSFGKCNLV